MGIGLGIFLLVVGAIFYFTPLDSNLLDTNLNTVGIILMIAGALAIVLALIMNAQRARTQHTVVTERRGTPDVVERRVDGDEVVERRVERTDGTY
jgi:drug/metabolite transporter (DMT)-like permease